MTISKNIIALTGALLVAGGLGGWMVSRKLVERSSPVPTTLGVSDGQLTPCPDSPNCVSTQAIDEEHSIPPIPYTMPLNEARTLMLEIVGSLPGTEISMVSANYIHAVTRTRVFAFIDDTEIYMDDDAKLIHIRAASRLGYGDMGVNRRRAEAIIAKFKDMGR